MSNGAKFYVNANMINVAADVSMVVVQRQTVDWSGMTLAAFREQSRAFCKLWGKPQDYVWQLRELWDNTFDISYLQTRAALKSLAEAQLAKARGIAFVPYADYRNLPRVNAPYLFIDDDDWVAPDIALHRTVFDEQSAFAWLWRTVSVGSPQQPHPVFVWGLNGRCMTNNYAVNGQWLWDAEDHFAQVVQHSSAAQMLAKMVDVPQLDIVITATNKSPCSSVSLDRGLRGELHSTRLVTLVEQFLAKMAQLRVDDLHAAHWLAEPIAQTVALFEQVYSSRCVSAIC
jgi:hypothetical protein